MAEKDDLKELNKKLEIMMRRLDYIEAVLTETKEYPELAQVMGGSVWVPLYTVNPSN